MISDRVPWLGSDLLLPENAYPGQAHRGKSAGTKDFKLVHLHANNSKSLKSYTSVKLQQSC